MLDVRRAAFLLSIPGAVAACHDPAGEFGARVALDGEYAYWADPVSVYRKHK